MLSNDAQDLWSEYLRAEQDRIREVMMPALDRFIEALLRQEEATRRDWAFRSAEDIADHGMDIPVRFPLFQRVLLPALVAGVHESLPGCARWLAHFESLLSNTRSVNLPEHLWTSTGLLQEAIRVDPSDTRARRLLVERLASHFEYTLHALPAGILYGHNGATIVECDELIQELAEFREHLGLLGETARYAELAAECELHFGGYREYLAAGRPQGSYERFLSAGSNAKPEEP